MSEQTGNEVGLSIVIDPAAAEAGGLVVVRTFEEISAAATKAGLTAVESLKGMLESGAELGPGFADSVKSALASTEGLTEGVVAQLKSLLDYVEGLGVGAGESIRKAVEAASEIDTSKVSEGVQELAKSFDGVKEAAEESSGAAKISLQSLVEEAGLTGDNILNSLSRSLGGVTEVNEQAAGSLREYLVELAGASSEAVKEVQQAATESAQAISEVAGSGQDAVEAVREQVGGLKEGLAELGSAHKKAGQGAKQQAADMKTLETPLNKVLGLVKQLRGYILGLFAGFSVGAIIREVGQLEKALSGVRKELTGADGAGAALDEITAKAKVMGVTTKYSAAEAAGAMETLVDAGASAQEAMYGVANAADLASASSIGLDKATTVITQTSKQFGLSMGESLRVVNALAAADVETNASVTLLSQGLRLAGASAKSANLSMEDTVLALAGLSEAGYVGRRSLAAMNGVLAALGRPSKELSSKMLELGINTAEWAEKLGDPNVGLVGLLLELEEAGVRGQKAITTFGAQGGEAISKLIALGPRLRGIREAFDDPAKGAKAMAEVMNDNLVGAFAKLTTAARGLLVYLGTSDAGLSYGLKVVVKGMTDFIRGLVGVNSYVDAASDKLSTLNKAGKLLRDNFNLLASALTGFVIILGVKYVAALVATISLKIKATEATLALAAAERGLAAASGKAAVATAAAGVAAAGTAAAQGAAALAVARSSGALGSLGVAATAASGALKFLSGGGKLLLAALGGWPGVILAIAGAMYVWINSIKDAGKAIDDLYNQTKTVDLTRMLDMHPVQQAAELKIMIDRVKEFAQAREQASRDIARTESQLRALPGQFGDVDREGSAGARRKAELETQLKAFRDARELADDGWEMAAKQGGVARLIVDGTVKTMQELTEATERMGITSTSAYTAAAAAAERYSAAEVQLAESLQSEYDPGQALKRQLDQRVKELEGIKTKLREDARKGVVDENFKFKVEDIDRYIGKLKSGYDDQRRGLDEVRAATKAYDSALGDLGGRIPATVAINRKYTDQLEALELAHRDGGIGALQYKSDVELLTEAKRQDIAIADDVARGVDSQVAAQSQLSAALKKGTDLSAGQRDAVMGMVEAYDPYTRQVQRARSSIEVLHAAQIRFATDEKFREAMMEAGATAETFADMSDKAKESLQRLEKAYKNFGREAGLVAAKLPELGQIVELEAHIKDLELLRSKYKEGSEELSQLDLVLQQYRDDLDAANESLDKHTSAVGKIVDSYLTEENALKGLYDQRQKLDDLMNNPSAMQREGKSLAEVQKAYERNAKAIMEAQQAMSSFPVLAANIADAVRGIWEDFGRGLNESITNLFLSAFEGMSDFKKSLRTLFKSILASITALIVQNQIVVPILMKVAGFLGGSGKIYKNGQEAVDELGSGTAGIGGVLKKVTDGGIPGALKNILGTLFGGLFGKKGVETIPTQEQKPEEIIKKQLETDTDRWIEANTTSTDRIVASLYDIADVSPSGSSAAEAVKEADGGMDEIIVTATRYSGERVEEAVNAGTEQVKAVIQESSKAQVGALGWLGQLLGWIKDGIGGLIGKIGKFALGAAKEGGGALWDGIKAVGGFLKDGLGSVSEGFGSLLGGIDKLFGLDNTLKGGFEKLTTSLGSGWSTVTGALGKGWDKITGAFGMGNTDVVGSIKKLADTGIVEAAQGVLGGGSSAQSGFTPTSVGSISGGLSTAGAAIGGRGGELLGTAATVLNVGSKAFAALKDFGGFARGFTEAFTGLNKTTQSVIQNAVYKKAANQTVYATSTGGQISTGAKQLGKGGISPGESFGASVATVGAGIAGSYVGGRIAENFGTPKNTNVLVTAGTTVGAYVGSIWGQTALGAFLGGVVGGIVSSAVGGAKKVTSSGVALNLNPGGAVNVDSFKYEKKAQSLFRGFGDPKYKITDKLEGVDAGLTAGLRGIFDSLLALTENPDALLKLSDTLNNQKLPRLEISKKELDALGAADLERKTDIFDAERFAHLVAKYDRDESGELSPGERRNFNMSEFLGYNIVKGTYGPTQAKQAELTASLQIAKWFEDVALKAVKAAEPILGETSQRFLQALTNFVGDIANFVDGFQAALVLDKGLKVNVGDEADKLIAEKDKNSTQLVLDQLKVVQDLTNRDFKPRDLRPLSIADNAALDRELKALERNETPLSGAGEILFKRKAEYDQNELFKRAAAGLSDAKEWQIIPAKMAELGVALLDLKGAAVGLIISLHEVGEALKESIKSTRDRIFESGLDPDQLYQRRRTQFTEAVTALKATADPGEIQGFTDNARAVLEDTFFSLDESQQDALRPEYLKALDDLQTLVDERIGVGVEAAEGLTVTLDAAITAQILEAATQQVEAAVHFDTSVNAFGQWVQVLNDGGYTLYNGQQQIPRTPAPELSL